MGLKALANGVISFTDVRVPAENLIGEEGTGLKIALTTLNNGRLSLPNGSVGTAKLCLRDLPHAGPSERVQWGKPIGKHEAIAHKIADMAAHTFAMESVAEPRDRDGRPRRLRHPPRGRGRQGVEHRPRAGRSSTTRCRSAAAAATRPSSRSRRAASSRSASSA